MGDNSHAINSIRLAEQRLKATLAVLSLPVRASYASGEVCKILGFSIATFWRLVRAYERDEKGRLRRPYCLDTSILTKHRRVNYVELLDFIRRNDGALREVKGTK